jgi:hypothetical protein
VRQLQQLVLALCLAWAALSGAPAAYGAALALQPAPLKLLVLPMSARLESALRTALVPWGIRIERVGTERAQLMSGSAHGAKLLASERRAEAVVWVADDGPGTSLWVYDARLDAAAFRAVPRSRSPKGVTRAPSPSLAAALALSVKTLLRAGQEPTSPERMAAAESVTEAEWERLPWVTAPPPRPAAHEQRWSDAPLHEAPVLREPAIRSAWQLTLGAELRAHAHVAGPEPRYRLALRHAPWQPFGGERAALWLELGMDAGAPSSIESAQFRGEYQELAGSFGLGVSQVLGERWRVGLQLGAQAHRSTLSGAITPEGTAIEQRRLSPSVSLRPALEIVLDRFTLLVQPGAGYFLRRQSYAVDGLEVLRTRSPWYSLGVGLGLLL